jgi:hypothetical protein
MRSDPLAMKRRRGRSIVPACAARVHLIVGRRRRAKHRSKTGKFGSVTAA